MDYDDVSNSIETFKDHDPRMSGYAGTGVNERVIFYQGDCEDGYYSFTADGINKLFITGNNHRSILPRIILTMRALQTGYHTREYPGKMAEYPYAQEEFPRKYLALIHGLNEQALKIIKAWDMSEFTSQVPKDLGATFVNQLQKDKTTMAAQPTMLPPAENWLPITPGM